MRPPIVIDENGDISFFETVEAAARYVEPIDVRNDEYVVYDSTGHLLKLVPTEPVVSISGYLFDAPKADQLVKALRSLCERSAALSLGEEVELDALIEHCVRNFGYTG